MIISTSNPQVKNLVQLKKKAKVRRQQGIYVVEGLRMFCEAPGHLVEGIYVSESFLAEPSHQRLLEGKKYEVLSDVVFSFVSDTKTPQGILCLVRTGETVTDWPDDAQGGIWLLLENIQDPGNLGTMIRTGEGAGIAGVIMDAKTADIYNPKTIRSTMGSIYRVPFLVTEDLAGAVRRLKEGGIRIYAAQLEGSVCYDAVDYTTGCAFLIGNEGNGLCAETAALADLAVCIPMKGEVESLNAAMAAGILMYEAGRQRRKRCFDCG